MSVSIDTSTNSGYQTGSSYSWSHTTGGAERYLVVGVSMLSVAASSVTGITYNGVALSSLGNATSGTGTVRVELWGLAAPAAGSNTIAVTLSAALDSSSGASSYTGVNQGSATEAFNSASATNVGAADATVNITTVTDNDMVVDVVATDDTAITVGSGQTQRSNVTGTLGSGATSSEPKAAAGSTTMSWTNVAALATWTIAGIGIKESGSSSSSSSSSCRSSSSSSYSSSSSSLSCEYDQYNVASACVMQLHMNEASWNGTSNEVVDSSGNSNHGTAVNGATPGVGKLNNCGVFDGANDYVTVANSVSLNTATGAGQARSICFWIKTTTTSNLVICEKGSNTGFVVQTNSGANAGKLSFRTNTASAGNAYTGVVNDGSWHFFVGTYDGAGVTNRVYVDGAFVSSHAETAPADNSSAFVIGARSGGTVAFPGSIDELCVFNRELTQAEITALYNIGNGTEVLFGCYSSSSSCCSSSSSSRSSSSSSSFGHVYTLPLLGVG